MRHLANNRGFTLLEVMIALIVTAIGFLGIAGMITISIRGNDFSSRMSEATSLAQDKLEELKNIDFSNLNTIPPISMALDKNATVLVAPNDGGTNGDETAADGIYTYHYVANPPNAPALNNFDLIWGVQLDFPAANLLRGFSTVTWKDANAQQHQVHFETIISPFSH